MKQDISQASSKSSGVLVSCEIHQPAYCQVLQNSNAEQKQCTISKI